MTAATAPFDTLLGLIVVEATSIRVVATLAVRPELCQPYGIVHGGVYASMVESVCSIGADLWTRAQGRGVVGVSNHTNFLRSARAGTLRAEAVPIHQGRSQQLWQAEIVDSDGRAIARGEIRFANLDPAEPNRP